MCDRMQTCFWGLHAGQGVRWPQISRGHVSHESGTNPKVIKESCNSSLTHLLSALCLCVCMWVFVWEDLPVLTQHVYVCMCVQPLRVCLCVCEVTRDWICVIKSVGIKALYLIDRSHVTDLQHGLMRWCSSSFHLSVSSALLQVTNS